MATRLQRFSTAHAIVPGGMPNDSKRRASATSSVLGCSAAQQQGGCMSHKLQAMDARGASQEGSEHGPAVCGHGLPHRQQAAAQQRWPAVDSGAGRRGCWLLKGSLGGAHVLQRRCQPLQQECHAGAVPLPAGCRQQSRQGDRQHLHGCAHWHRKVGSQLRARSSCGRSSG